MRNDATLLSKLQYPHAMPGPTPPPSARHLRYQGQWISRKRQEGPLVRMRCGIWSSRPLRSSPRRPSPRQSSPGGHTTGATTASLPSVSYPQSVSSPPTTWQPTRICAHHDPLQLVLRQHFFQHRVQTHSSRRSFGHRDQLCLSRRRRYRCLGRRPHLQGEVPDHQHAARCRLPRFTACCPIAVHEHIGLQSFFLRLHSEQPPCPAKSLQTPHHLFALTKPRTFGRAITLHASFAANCMYGMYGLPWDI